jgi:hypothetical protein
MPSSRPSPKPPEIVAMLQSKRRSSPSHLNPVPGRAGERVERSVPAQFLRSGRDRGVERDDGEGGRRTLWTAACPQRRTSWVPLGPHAGQDRLPWWPGRCRTTAGSSARGPRDLAAELGTGHRRGLARAVGNESHAHQRLDEEIRSGGTASGGRYSGACRSRRVEIGDLSALCGVVDRAHEELDGYGSFRAGPLGGAD